MALRKIFAVAERPIVGLGLVSPPPIRVEFPNFDGSLGQLFSCVRERKIDLAGVPLLPICEAYFLYLMTQDDPNLDESAAALAALAYLLERKAWLLLPLPDSPIEEEGLLSIGETSIHEFFEAVSFLRRGHEVRSHLHFRSPNLGPHPYELPYEMEELSVSVLAEALQRVLMTVEKPVMESVSRVGRSLVAEMRNLLLKISNVWQGLGEFLVESSTREDAVYVFLSLLELIRLGQIRARIEDGIVEFSQA